MATEITITDQSNKEHCFNYKTVHKDLHQIPRGIQTKSCELSVDIKSVKDIERIREFLRDLEYSMK